MVTPPRSNPAAVQAAVRFLPRQNASFPTAIRASLEGCGAAAVAFFDAAFDVFDEAARAVVSGPPREGVVEAAGRGARLVAQGVGARSGERRVGKECVSTCRSRCAPSI